MITIYFPSDTTALEQAEWMIDRFGKYANFLRINENSIVIWIN